MTKLSSLDIQFLSTIFLEYGKMFHVEIKFY